MKVVKIVAIFFLLVSIFCVPLYRSMFGPPNSEDVYLFHIVKYIPLGFLFGWFSLILGAAEEIVQLYIPMRHGVVPDIQYNWMGCCLGMILKKTWNNRRAIVKALKKFLVYLFRKFFK